MATSNKQALTATGTLIIKEALQLLGVIGEGVDPSATTTTDCLRSLNYMIKGWQGKHMGNLWTAERLVFFPEANQHMYPISASSRIAPYGSVNFTYLSSAASAGASSISVDTVGTAPTSGTAQIGVETTSGTIEWFTDNTGSTTTTFELDSTLAAAAAVDNIVWFYDPVSSTDWIPPKVISSATWVGKPTSTTGVSTTSMYDAAFGSEVPLVQIARNDYNNLTSKHTTGRVNQFHWANLEHTAELHLWPAPDKETDVLMFWVHKQIDIMDAESNDVEYPQEFFRALAWNLAADLMPKYGVDQARERYITPRAFQYLSEAESADTEGYMQTQPADNFEYDN